MTLGDKVRILRESHGWSRGQLERASSVPYYTIFRLEENTHKSIRIFDGEKIARAFGISVECLLEGVEEEHVNA